MGSQRDADEGMVNIGGGRTTIDCRVPSPKKPTYEELEAFVVKIELARYRSGLPPKYDGDAIYKALQELNTKEVK